MSVAEPTQYLSVAKQWNAHRAALAQWMMRHMVNRTDCCGAYTPLKVRGTPGTDGKPIPKSYTCKRELTLQRLQQHFSTWAQPEDVIGSLTISLGDTCNCVSLDIDFHSDADNTVAAEMNLRFAMAIYILLDRLGLRPLMWESNGRGGYHLDIIFSEPIPAADAYRFGKWLVRDWKSFGFKSPPESFPKQQTRGEGYGNWLRLPGRHHTNDHWATVYDSESGDWLEGEAAAMAILSHQPVTPAAIPPEAIKAPEPRPQTIAPVHYTGNVTDDIETAVAALNVIPGADDYDIWILVGLACHGTSTTLLDAWEQWSRSSSKCKDGDCAEKWQTFGKKGGASTGIGTLCYLADQTGLQWRPKRDHVQKIDPGVEAFVESFVKPSTPTDDIDDEMPPLMEGEEPAPLKPLEAATDPHRLARLYLRDHHTRRDGSWTLVSWQGEFWWWNGSAYVPLKQHALVASVTSCVKAEFDRVNLWEQKNFVPKKETDQPPKVQPVTKALLNNVVNAIASLTAQPDELSMPSWLCGDPPFPAREVLATTKTLLHLPSLIAGTSTGVSPTPMLFSANCLSYEFDQQAVCENWLRFLNSLWPNDPESIESLQEWFGYLLLPDTRQHKLLMLIGPPRSGKGTITRVLQLLLGAGNVASPTLSSLAGDFGLWPLLNKYVALIPDARLSGRDDSVAVVERILSLTGEDPQDIHRKCLPTLTGIRMPIRFVLMSNELPNLRDASGAFMTRVILLTMTESFVGREDRTLGDRLATELPGILNWSIEGWKRLNQRGYFLQPGSSTEMLTDLENLSSPIRQFVDDACDIGPGCAAPVDALFKAWAKWCEENHRDYTGNNQTFGRDLRAAAPHLKVVNRRAGERRERWYEGIRVRLDW